MIQNEHELLIMLTVKCFLIQIFHQISHNKEYWQSKPSVERYDTLIMRYHEKFGDD